jgi:hypothetical protein
MILPFPYIEKVLNYLQGKTSKLPEEIKLVKKFTEGLSREVALYSLKCDNVNVKYFIVATGNDVNAVMNESILRKIEKEIFSIFPTTFYFFKDQHSSKYYHFMEYIEGENLSKTLFNAENQILTKKNIVLLVLNQLNQLHSQIYNPKLFPECAFSTYFEEYHIKRISYRLQQLKSVFPAMCDIIENSGFNIKINKIHNYSILGLLKTHEILSGNAGNFNPNTLKLIHGDTKPENIILSNQLVRFIDPHLSFGDEYVDYVKLYYWIITDEVFSKPTVNEIFARDFTIESIVNRDIEIKFYPKSQSIELALYYINNSIKWDKSAILRFNICCGSMLIWQGVRLLEAFIDSRLTESLDNNISKQNNKWETFKASFIDNNQINLKEMNSCFLALILGVMHFHYAALYCEKAEDCMVKQYNPFKSIINMEV